ncbi:hypothetical protein KY325_01530, partial [Candidatus Woesearchaeota archaeon]|nr:hypothetical protein [Candidatus Woesearchaeota archaeon]
MELSLKPFYLFEWDPVLFYRGKVYLVGQGQEDGCLVAYNKRLSLVKLDNIETYENTFFDHEKAHIEEYQKDFLEKTVQKEFKENDAAQKELAENEILSFIVRDVLPALTQQNEKKEIDSLLGVEETETKKKTALLSDIISDVTVKEDASIIIDSWIKKVEQEYAPKIEKMAPSTDRIDQLLRDVNYAPAPSHYVQDQILDLLDGTPGQKESVERNTDNSVLSSVLTDSSSI